MAGLIWAIGRRAKPSSRSYGAGRPCRLRVRNDLADGDAIQGHSRVLVDAPANLLGCLARGILGLEDDGRASFIAALEPDPVAGDKAGRLLDGGNDPIAQELGRSGCLLDADPRDDCVHRDPPLVDLKLRELPAWLNRPRWVQVREESLTHACPSCLATPRFAWSAAGSAHAAALLRVARSRARARRSEGSRAG